MRRIHRSEVFLGENGKERHPRGHSRSMTSSPARHSGIPKAAPGILTGQEIRFRRDELLRARFDEITACRYAKDPVFDIHALIEDAEARACVATQYSENHCTERGARS